MAINVPLLDLKAQYRTIKSEVDPKIMEVIESQRMLLGPEAEQLESTLADYTGTKHAVAVSSGTDALLMALMAYDIGPGDEVIIPTYSFFATAGVAARLHAKPVFVDSDPVTYNIDPNLIEQEISDKTKAIIPVHLYGQCADMDQIMDIAKKHNIPVIEDAAQAIGVEYGDGRKAGSIGEMGCFSFYPTKNLGGFGDGGLIATNNDDLAAKLKQMRNHGMEPKYHHKFVGGNFRMDAINAAALNVKFNYLEQWHEARRQNAEKYTNAFTEAGLAEDTGITEFSDKNKILLPKAVYKINGYKNHHIYNQYNIRIQKRGELKAFLGENGIGSEIYYPVPFHRQECFEYLGNVDSKFPVSNRLAAESLAIPVYPELTDEQTEYVIDKIKEFLSAV